MSYLIRVAFKPDRVPTGDALAKFPFSVRAIRTLPVLDLDAPVTFFVGENGSGKSTLIEAIASTADLRQFRRSNLGSTIDGDRDTTLESQRALASALRLSWAPRTREGFFLRAEDFFGFLKSQGRNEVETAWAFSGMDRLPQTPELIALKDKQIVEHTQGMDSRSHGESFFDAFDDRVKTKGIYFLDEPETPLSPKRQVEFLRFLIRKSEAGAQFVIATHSPILLACPGARIYSFDETPIREASYDELAHVRVVREFMRDPTSYLATTS